MDEWMYDWVIWGIDDTFDFGALYLCLSAMAIQDQVLFCLVGWFAMNYVNSERLMQPLHMQQHVCSLNGKLVLINILNTHLSPLSAHIYQPIYYNRKLKHS